MVTTVYLVRHCESLGNVARVFQGHTDENITSKGELQLEYLSERFKEIPIDIIYTSPLIRTLKTADAVNKYLQVPIISERRFIEIFGGDMEGRAWEDVAARYPDIYRTWSKNISKFKAPGGESVLEAYERVTEVLMEIVKANKGKRIAVSSHGGAIFLMLSFAGGYSNDGLDECDYWCQNTAISKLVFDDDLNPEIIFYNDYAHIEQDKKTAPASLLFA